MTKKLILDLDTGIDDALAIAYALGSPEAELVGITATYGNVLMEDSVRNSLAVLDILGADSVPVHPGLPHASTAEDFAVQEISTFIHGRNGLGEADIAPSTRSAAATDAVDFLIEASRQYGEVGQRPWTRIRAWSSVSTSFSWAGPCPSPGMSIPGPRPISVRTPTPLTRCSAPA